MTRARFLAPLALLLAAGCSTHPGAAAVVNGHEISIQRIDDLVPQWCQALSPDPFPTLAVSAARRQVLVDLIVLDVARAEVARRDLPTGAKRDLDTYQGVVGALTDALGVLGRDDVFAALDEADIEVDPRFGIDGDGNLVGDTGSISTSNPPPFDFTNAAGLPGEKPCG